MSNRDNLLSSFILDSGNSGKWVFNEQVADVFPDMIQRSVPGYANIISMIGILAEHFVRPGTKIYDLGCSLGSVTLSIRKKIFYDSCQIIAVDNSSAMIRRCRQHINAHVSPISVKVIKDDIRYIEVKNASMVVLNFTMQFLNQDDKQDLLRKIYHGINPGGILILSEKLSFDNKKIDNLLSEMHHSFKRANGYSELEIIQKGNMLKHAMFTNSFETHKIRLRKAGFKHIEIWFQFLNFGSLISIK